MQNNNDIGGQETPSSGVPMSGVVLQARLQARKDPLVAAIPLLRWRLRQAPEDPRLLANLAEGCLRAGFWEEAATHGRHLHALTGSPAGLKIAANSLLWLGDRVGLTEVESLALQTGDVRMQRKIAGPLALHRLKCGDLAGGFGLQHELREDLVMQHPLQADSSVAWWDGQRFTGVLLVIAQQSLGEELLVASFYAELAALGQQVLIECDSRLLPLFRRSFPSLAFVPRRTHALQDAIRPGTVYRKTALSELAFFLHAGRMARQPASWLVPDAGRVAEFRASYRAQWPGECIAGICWRSHRPGWGATHKSLALTDIPHTLATPGVRFVSLQYGPIDADIDAARQLSIPVPCVDPAVDALADIDTLAAQIAALDFVVTTSNTTAHLAGALGVPTLVLLPPATPVIWYWGYEGENTGWYPAIRLLRGGGAEDRPAFDLRAAGALVALQSQVAAGDFPLHRVASP